MGRQVVIAPGQGIEGRLVIQGRGLFGGEAGAIALPAGVQYENHFGRPLVLQQKFRIASGGLLLLVLQLMEVDYADGIAEAIERNSDILVNLDRKSVV